MSIVKSKDYSEGLVIVDKNKYNNIEEVTHRFDGTITVEEAFRDIVLSRLKEKKVIRNDYNKLFRYK